MRSAMTRTLKKRIERLERAGVTDLEIGVRAFANRMGLAPDPLLQIVEKHQQRLANQVWANGSLTWEALCCFRNSGAFA
jgi:hypothetical protein